MPTAPFPVSGFKECDIRGTFGTDITPEVAYRLGRAIATQLPDQAVVIGGDFRITTVQLMDELRRGLLDSGARVFDLGQLSTPGYYFARQVLGIPAGVMVTASHSPSAWNGFKPILGELPVQPDELEALRDLAVAGKFRQHEGSLETLDIKPSYVSWLLARFAGLAGRAGRMVFDCGSGAAGWALGDVIAGLQLNAVSLLDWPDGLFPYRAPDISGPEDLADLQQAVLREQATMGFGFDGDGDRVGLVDERGRRIPSDRLIAWLAGMLVRRSGGGEVVLDLKLSQLAADEVERAGGTAIPQRSGHTFIKRTLIERAAVLGGEYSGHIFFGELSGIDDALFAALLLASLIADEALPASRLFDALPAYAPSPDLRLRWQGNSAELMAQMAEAAQADGAKCLRLDGVKAYYPDGWALLRASVTEPAVTLRFEGKTNEGTRAIAERFLRCRPELAAAILPELEKKILLAGSSGVYGLKERP